jgi:hypothetical protein
MAAVRGVAAAVHDGAHLQRSEKHSAQYTRMHTRAQRLAYVQHNIDTSEHYKLELAAEQR